MGRIMKRAVASLIATLLVWGAGATTLSLAKGASHTALNGAFFGTEQVSFQPVISADGNSFSAHWTSTGFDQVEIRW